MIPMRGSRAALAGATGTLLTIRLLAAAGNLAATERLDRTLALVCLVADHSLMHEGLVKGGAEDPLADFERVYLLARHVKHLDLWHALLSLSYQRPAGPGVYGEAGSRLTVR